MSSSGQTTTNSNTLLFRSNPSVPGVNNMYALDKYNKPLPAGQVFVTSTNGVMNQETYYDGLKWSNYPAIHDVNMANYSINNVSTVNTSVLTTSNLNISVPSQTIQITDQSYPYVIEEGVSEIYFQMIGAGGTSVTSDPNSGRGGNGGYMSGTILVNANGHNITGQTLTIGAGKCNNYVPGAQGASSSASYITINNRVSNDVIIAIAGSGGNGGSVIGGSTTYQAEGGHGGGDTFNPSGDQNAGRISVGYNGTTNNGQTTVTAGKGATTNGGDSGTPSGNTGSTHTTGFLPVLGGLGASFGSACAGAGGGGYSGGGGGGISTDGTISSGGGGGSSYYAGSYVNNVTSSSGNNLSPGTLPTNGRADQDGIVILTIYKQNAISTSGDIDCSGTIMCNVLKYNVLDPPLYVSPQDVWSNFPAEGPVDISNYDINNIRTANVNTLNLSGGQYIFETLADNVARPSLNIALNPYEIRAVSVNELNIRNGKAGFLQLTAGGDTDTTNMTYLQLSGYSSVPDMNNNIVFGTAGLEKMRITSNGNVGIGISTPGATLDVSGTVNINGITNITNTLSLSSVNSQLLLFNQNTRFATNAIYDGCYIEMNDNKPLYITNMNNAIQYAQIGIISSQFNGNVNVMSTLTASTINAPNNIVANFITTTNATVNNTLNVVGQLEAGNINVTGGTLHNVGKIEMNNGVITGASTINTNYATVNNTLNVAGQLEAGNINVTDGTLHNVGSIEMNNGVITGASTINTNYVTINNKLIANGPIEAGNISCNTLTYTALSPNVVTGIIPGDGISISGGSQINNKYVGDITISASVDAYQETYMFIYSNTTINYSDISQYTFLDYLLVGGGGGGGGGNIGGDFDNFGAGGGGSGYITSSFYIDYKLLENGNYKYSFYQTVNDTITISNYIDKNIVITIGQGGVGGVGVATPTESTTGGTGGTTSIIIGTNSKVVEATGGLGGQPYYNGLCKGGDGFNGGGGGVGGSTAGSGGSGKIYYGGNNGFNAPNAAQSGAGGGLGAGNGQISGGGDNTDAGGGGGAGSCLIMLNGTQTGGNGSLKNGTASDIAAGNGMNNTGAGGGGGSYKASNYYNGGTGGSGYAILWFHS